MSFFRISLVLVLALSFGALPGCQRTPPTMPTTDTTGRLLSGFEVRYNAVVSLAMRGSKKFITVRLDSFDKEKKADIVKALSDVTGLGPEKAAALLDNVPEVKEETSLKPGEKSGKTPKIVKEENSQAAAEQTKKTLEAAGGTVTVHNHLETFLEMLDEDKQLANWRTRIDEKTGKEFEDAKAPPDPAAARNTVDTALKAIVELHEKRPELDLSSLKPAIEKLTSSENKVLEQEAKKALIAVSQK